MPSPLLRLWHSVLRGQGISHNMLRTIAAQLLVLALNISTGVLTARLLGPSGRGVYAAMVLWPQFIALLAAGGLPYALLYYGYGAKPEELRRAIGTTLLLGVVMGVLGAGLGLGGSIRHGGRTLSRIRL